MRAGTLRKQITLQHNTPTTSATGQQSPSWMTYATVWGQVVAETSTEHEVGKKLISVGTWKVTIRYRDDVTAEDRIVWGSRILNIIGSPNPDERRRQLTMTAHDIGAQ